MIVACLVAIGIAVINGFLYRFGGSSKEEGAEKYPWVPAWMFQTKTRDVGIALTTTGFYLGFMPSDWWAYLICFAGTWGALTTYWDNVFGYDNFFAHGFMIGLAKFGLAIASGAWIWFGVQCVALAIMMGVLSALATDVDVEEIGRGSSTGLVLPLMLIG